MTATQKTLHDLNVATNTALQAMANRLAGLTDDQVVETVRATYRMIDQGNPDCDAAMIVAQHAETELANRIGWPAVEKLTDEIMQL